MRFEEEEIQAIAEAVIQRLKANLADLTQNPLLQDTLLDVNELANYLQVRPRWIYRKIRDGIPHMKAGKYLKFRKSEVDEWMRRNGER